MKYFFFEQDSFKDLAWCFWKYWNELYVFKSG